MECDGGDGVEDDWCEVRDLRDADSSNATISAVVDTSLEWKGVVDVEGVGCG